MSNTFLNNTFMLFKKNAIQFYFSICVIFSFSQCNNISTIEKCALNINKDCPLKMDEYTLLLNAKATGDTLVFNYRTTYSMDTFKDSEYLKFINENSLYNIATNIKMKEIRESNATIIYRYKDTEEHILLNLKYTPEDYNTYQPTKLENGYSYLMQLVNTSKDTLPISIAKNIYITKISAEYPDTLKYTVKAENLDATKEEIVIKKEMLINRLKERGTFTLLRDYKVVFCYEFFDKNNILMEKLMITPRDYGL
ncbi:hypothetical protein [Bacteroides sp. 224]|uniref:hypothetical protein n=1 Tax=Bacteroides sp. 224 TaxID=2302936 RepID=UPI0013D3751E|nr:hypothetical protein [Bacteroides sp. 224]NDV65214.1 hypothetical protein [Bacteroides sp. 224]